MQIELAVRDAVGGDIPATVECLIQDPRSDHKVVVVLPRQQLPDSADDSFAVVVNVHHPDYVPDIARVYRQGPGSPWLSDNSCFSVAQRGATLTLILTLGRIRPAPTEHIPDDQIATLKRNPSGVLTYHDDAGFIYHSLFNQEVRKFRILSDPILDVKTDPGQDWARLKHRDVNTDPAGNGNFFLVEYGRADIGPRFLLGVFFPAGKLAADILDFVLFYTPTTALSGRFPYSEYPFTKGYPYPLTNMSQEYPRHAQAYMFNLKYLAYQMLASKKQAVLVLPIAPYGNWGPLQNQEGVARLLAELCQFLHRELFTTSFYASRRVNSGYLRAGASVRSGNTLGSGVQTGLLAPYAPIPRVGRVAISCFSSGAVPLYSMLTSTTLDFNGPYSKLLFGVEPMAYQRAFGQQFAFRRNFQEVWDVDGAHAPYHGWAKFETALASWFYADPDRKFRLYHSAYTAGQRNPASDKKSALAPITKECNTATRTAKQSPGNQSVTAEELRDPHGRWSSLLFANNYLLAESEASVTAQRDALATNPDQWKPAFPWIGPDNNHAHQFLPQIALGHAATVSGLRDMP